jgi:hypothetical protein
MHFRSLFFMKRMILGGLSVLLFTAVVAPAVKAEVNTATMPLRTTIASPAVTPFNLVSLAYQGFLTEAGVPKFSSLLNQYSLGQFTAEELVQGAIASNRLPASAIEDEGYVRSVDQQLRSLARDSESSR